ncbi:MAG: hypothetical protein ABW039_07520 [Sphingobium sp.]
MYSEGDLQDAVVAGAISAEAAEALRNHVATLRSTPVVDEEHFRLLTGFNDIFVSLACVILLVAVGWLGDSVRLGAQARHPSVLSGLLVAAVSWGLAEYFTRQRRMALPSILLLGGFVGGVGFALVALGMQLVPEADDQTGSLILAGAAAVSALAAWAHWHRFMVPITVAAGAAAAGAVVAGLVLSVLHNSEPLRFGLLLATGLAIFALAMRWDMSDRARTTRRADVAFWLHLTAAPMIAHALFHLMGVFEGSDIPIGKAVIVIAFYIGFGLIALAIDRRALLVSGLAYVLYAIYALFQKVGAVELSFALTALVIGTSLLLLSAWWHLARANIVGGLPPALVARLPYVESVPA